MFKKPTPKEELLKAECQTTANRLQFPNFQDTVRHKKNETTGIVIAKYTDIYGTTFFDVRGFDDQIHYATPAENWETVMTEEERT